MRGLLRDSFKFSLLRNFCIQIFWWIIFFPGFYSGDSFGAVAMAKTGELSNSGTASWALYVRVFSLFGRSFPVLTLFSGLILVYGLTRIAYAMFNNRIAAVSSLLLAITPVVAGMGITLWHDIPLTSGFLLITAFFIKFFQNPEDIDGSLWRLLVPGALLISFKPNGLPTLIVFTLIVLFFKASKAGFKYLIVSILLSGAFTFVGSNLILGMSPINNYYAQEWMRGDISCYAATSQGQGFVEKEIPGIASTQKWASQEACGFLNKANLSGAEKTAAQEFVPKAWLELAKKDPLFVFQTHMNRHEYLIPLPISGIPTMPFLHSTIEFEGQGIEWAFPSVAEKARVIMRAWNAARGLTGWAGLWALVLIALAVFGKQKSLTPAIVMSIAMIGILFVVAPIPDGRYALFVLIAGQLALIGNVVQWAQTGSNRRPTD